MCQKFRLNFVQQNDYMMAFLSAIIYLFCALISEYIETLNCLNFSKNWKNGGVLKLLTGSVDALHVSCFFDVLLLVVTVYPCPCTLMRLLSGSRARQNRSGERLSP